MTDALAPMNTLERAIEYVAPGIAARRMHNRVRILALREAQSYYDGADKGRRGKSIRRTAAAPDTISARSLPSLRAGSHDLVRNNPHAARGVDAIVSNTIGRGISVRFKQNGSRASRIEDLASETLHTPTIDFVGRLTYQGLQALAMRTMVEAGEALIVRRRVNDTRMPIRLQVIEPEHLDDRKNGLLSDGRRIIQGVQYDAVGQREGYWLLKEHPGASFLTSYASEFFAADDVIHLYRLDRPGQVRGIPWLAPVLLRLADFDDYENAQLVRQKIAACFAVFYFDTSGGPRPDELTTEKVEPGMIHSLGPSSDVKFGTPPQVNDYESYAKVSLRAIAQGLGISYEALTGDLEGVNFTSGRMGWLEFQRNIDRWRHNIILPQACERMTQWWLEAAAMTGQRINNVSAVHTPPRREMISPEREIPANTAAIRSGQKSLVEVLQESGKDLERHIEEIAESNDLLDDHELILDSDPRKVSLSGVMHPGEFKDE